jgi:hypothetical protein
VQYRVGSSQSNRTEHAQWGFAGYAGQSLRVRGSLNPANHQNTADTKGRHSMYKYNADLFPYFLRIYQLFSNKIDRQYLPMGVLQKNLFPLKKKVC